MSWGGVSSLDTAEVVRTENVDLGELRTWLAEGKLLHHRGPSGTRIPITELPALRALRDGTPICPTCRNVRRILGGECPTCTPHREGVAELTFGVCHSCGQQAQLTTDRHSECLTCRGKNSAARLKAATCP